MPDDVPATGTDAPTPADDDAATEPESQDATYWKAEAEKLKTASRKWEDRAKANAGAAKELEQLRSASMTEMEKAVADARTEATVEAQRTFGARLVDAEVKAAAAGRPVDVEALLEGLDRTRFLTDEHEPDLVAIATWVDRIAPVPDDSSPAAFPDLGQGVRTGSGNGAALGDDSALLRDVKAKLGLS